jgi:prepilin-type N-terminal cleavage/methylation domain-containing protein
VPRRRRAQAFSLIELVMVIVIVAIAAVGIGSALMYSSRSLQLNETQQRSWQIISECADHVLGVARKPGSYAAVTVGSPSAICNGLPADAGYARVVNVTIITSATPDTTLCSVAGWTCKRVQITVTRAGLASTLNFMVFNY